MLMTIDSSLSQLLLQLHNVKSLMKQLCSLVARSQGTGQEECRISQW